MAHVTFYNSNKEETVSGTLLPTGDVVDVEGNVLARFQFVFAPGSEERLEKLSALLNSKKSEFDLLAAANRGDEEVFYTLLNKVDTGSLPGLHATISGWLKDLKTADELNAKGRLYADVCMEMVEKISERIARPAERNTALDNGSLMSGKLPESKL